MDKDKSTALSAEEIYKKNYDYYMSNYMEMGVNHHSAIISAMQEYAAQQLKEKEAEIAAFIAGATSESASDYWYAKFQEEQGWVKVEDRLPTDENRTEYLCYDSYHRKRRVLVFNPHLECWDNEDGDDYYTDLVGGKVSHYRPLPPLPTL